MNGQNKLEGYITQGLKDIPMTNSLVFWAHSYGTKKIKSCDYDSRDLIHNLSLYLWLTNGPYELECYIILYLKVLPRTNSLVYWAHLNVTKKIKCCDYDIHNSSFYLWLINGPDKLECYLILGLKGLQGTNSQVYWAHS